MLLHEHPNPKPRSKSCIYHIQLKYTEKIWISTLRRLHAWETHASELHIWFQIDCFKYAFMFIHLMSKYEHF